MSISRSTRGSSDENGKIIQCLKENSIGGWDRGRCLISALRLVVPALLSV